jgi:hypothetical protein
VLQFGDIPNMSNLPASELVFLKNRILSEEFANECWEAKLGEAWQEDFEC